MKRTWLVSIVFLNVIALLSIGFAAPAPTSAAQQGPQTIKVGVLASMTGFDAAMGKPLIDGAQLAVQEVNKGGGVFVKEFNRKIPMELVIQDMESSPAKAIARAEALNSQYNVPIAFGTTLINAAAATLEKNGMPALYADVTTNGMLQRGLKYYFVMGPMNKDFCDSAFGLFNSLPAGQKPTKWAIFEETTASFAVELSKFIEETAPKHGVTIVSHGKYKSNEPDLTPLIREAQSAGAEVVFSTPSTADSITLLKQIREVGYKPKAIITIRGSDDRSWGENGSLGDYVIGNMSFFHSWKFPNVDKLNAAYKAKFGGDTFPQSGEGWACIQVIADAIARAGTLDRAKLRDAVASTKNLMTVMGPITFGPDGGRINPVGANYQWQKGKQVLVYPKNLATEKFVYPYPW
jgi:branched-chain amino acid transport system substrate-binding protein